MGAGQDPEAGAGDGGEKRLAHSSSSGPLPPSEPPHLRGQDPAQYQYGTFHPPAPHPDVRPHPPVGFPRPGPPVGFPQPAPPPGFSAGGYHQQQQPYAPADPYYSQGYQTGPGTGYGPVVQGRPVEGRPMRMRPLPCCGLGMGWLLFIAGFFLAAIPWYIGAFILICVRVHDHREKPGYVACTVAAVVAAIVIPLGVTKGTDTW
ncbi:60S ribosomal protein L18a-like protein [Hordeum vulgare subsp. vulgare]|uniref:Predicted protein n=1 Tax=Hordeum vulgare subsp. vulgare TaxID=112509 RepID=F2DCH9_HORVV|nr:60S ribosomal protein L18a-like protein [Hordeum vulgare subsp. vulgare]BAJ92800.1 predicted protein [Hordeum vulgare subsp. vulgare]BAK01354.1 predicted protein [Hordeum vulgare subsp. vulgare]